MSEVPVQTSVDDVHAHAHKTGHSWVDLAIALSAITMSVISLFVAIGHGRTEEKLVAASSWPFLTFQTTKNGLQAGSRVDNIEEAASARHASIVPERLRPVDPTSRNRSVQTTLAPSRSPFAFGKTVLAVSEGKHDEGCGCRRMEDRMQGVRYYSVMFRQKRSCATEHHLVASSPYRVWMDQVGPPPSAKLTSE